MFEANVRAGAWVGFLGVVSFFGMYPTFANWMNSRLGKLSTKDISTGLILTMFDPRFLTFSRVWVKCSFMVYSSLVVSLTSGAGGHESASSSCFIKSKIFFRNSSWVCAWATNYSVFVSLKASCCSSLVSKFSTLVSIRNSSLWNKISLSLALAFDKST
jgi:hypothetical protein